MEHQTNEYESWKSRVDQRIKTIRGYPDHDLNLLVKLEVMITNILAEMKAAGMRYEDAKTFLKPLSDRLKSIEKRLANTDKLNRTDIEAFLLKAKAKNIKLIPLMDEIDTSRHATLPDLKTVRIDEPEFDPFKYTISQLATIATHAVRNANESAGTPIINAAKLGEFITELTLNYNVLSYHVFSHGFAVMQMFHTMYSKSELSKYLTPFELVGGCIAALGHDLNHRGKNNAYYEKKNSPLAQVYTGRSILESHHTALLIQFVNDPRFNLLGNMDPKIKTTFKELLIEAVLGTDMAKHTKMLGKFKKRVAATVNPSTAGSSDDIIQAENANDRRFLVKNIIHACDIGVGNYSFQMYWKWAVLVQQEFHEQSIREAEKGLEVTQMLVYKERKPFLKGQVFFLKMLSQPLWKEIVTLLPSGRVYTDNLERNIAKLEDESK